MANPFTPTQLRTALKKWFPNGGYEFWPNWETRGRPGGVQPAGFTIHHTGGSYTDSDAYMKFLFETGRPAEGIPGPLCQFAIGGSGRLYIGSIGRANHAGSGDFETRAAVGAENYDGYNRELKPDDNNWLSGNGQYYGVEICYPGTLPMKPAQYATAMRLAAMVVDHYGWSALSVFAHREHSTRKVDPGKITLYQFRKDVRILLAAGPSGTLEDDVSAEDVWNHTIAFDLKASTMLSQARTYAQLARENTDKLIVQVAGLKAAVDAIAAEVNIDADELAAIEAAAEKGANDALNERIADAEVHLTVIDETEPPA